MRVRQPENPASVDEPASPGDFAPPGYLAPPQDLVLGNEWRLQQPFRDAARSKDASALLTQAIIEQCRHHLSPARRNLGMVFADLAVSGRGCYADFVTKHPQAGGAIRADALSGLSRLGLTVAPALLTRAETEVLDRAYQVAWFLRGQASRGDLGWIAVSGEDDLPHRPVNVPRTPFPQHDLYLAVTGDLLPIAIQTRFAVATAEVPEPVPAARPTRDLPPLPDLEIPPDDRIILFMHGSDSRLEEANDLIPKLVRRPDGRPSGFSVVTMDMPGSGYVDRIDHTEVATWRLEDWRSMTIDERLQAEPKRFSLLPFLERFILEFVRSLSSRVGEEGFVESRLAAVIGGSLGGNLALRLARHGGWVRNAVAWSPGSVWGGTRDAVETGETGAIALGPILASVGGGPTLLDKIGFREIPSSRDQFFADAFDSAVPFKTQPDQWYRDDFPGKAQYVTGARLDRRETYTEEYRRWHWRISFEETLWSWQDPSAQNIKSRLLLGAGAGDDIWPVRIFTNTRRVAEDLASAQGDSFFFEETGHSIHAERPASLGERILDFLDSPRFGDLLDNGHRVWVEDFAGRGHAQVLFYFSGDGHWWLGDLVGARWSWSMVSDSSQLGNLIDDHHKIWTGDFTGHGRSQLLVFDNSGNGRWWLGDLTEPAPRPPHPHPQPGPPPHGGLSPAPGLNWSPVSSSSNFGDLLDHGHRVWVGDFAGRGHAQVLFYWSGGGGFWWLGDLAGGSWHWAEVGVSTPFGNPLDDHHGIWIDDFTGSGRAQVLVFDNSANGRWWLGELTGATPGMNWSPVSSSSNFGDLLDHGHRVWVGDFAGRGHAQVLFYWSGDGFWWLGDLAGGSWTWSMISKSSTFGNLLDGHHGIWIGDFTGGGHAQVLFHGSGDGVWRLGDFGVGMLSWFVVSDSSDAEESSGFVNLLDGQHEIWIADLLGSGHVQVLFYFSGLPGDDGPWWHGDLNGGSLSWSLVGGTAS
jgi:alpha-beta hydrolase superfamily lysophospholipase